MICLDVDGVVYSWGSNSFSGVGREVDNLAPRKVEGLPSIRMITCGADHNVCVDLSGSVWVWGYNQQGQLGLGNQKNQSKPCRIDGITVSKVACGYNHTVVLSTEFQLYGFGANEYGGLGLGHCTNVYTPTVVSLGAISRITDVICAGQTTFLLDEEGAVWTAGYVLDNEMQGASKRLEFQRLETGRARFLQCSRQCEDSHVLGIDEEDNLITWANRSLCTNLNAGPMKKALSVAVGHNSSFILTKEDAIYVCGDNSKGQLGLGHNNSPVSPQIHPHLTPDMFLLPSSSSITCDWSAYGNLRDLTLTDVQQLRCLEYDIRSYLTTNPLSLPIASNPSQSWSYWKDLVATEQKELDSLRAIRQKEHLERDTKIESTTARIQKLETQLQEARSSLSDLQNAKAQQKKKNSLEEHTEQVLKEYMTHCDQRAKQEQELNQQLLTKLKETPLQEWPTQDLDLVLWRMSLMHLQSWVESNQVNGSFLLVVLEHQWVDDELSVMDITKLRYHCPMMKSPGYSDFLQNGDDECLVCQHNTIDLTQKLLKEWKVPLDLEQVKHQNWTLPYLIYCSLNKDVLGIQTTPQMIQVATKLQELRKIHEEHLQRMNKLK